MNFTREPIIETVITPREGCKLVVRNSKGTSQEDYIVDSIEVVSFGHSFFFRSQERPKSFLVPVSDYEVLEVKETRMVLKNVSTDRSIKIGGGREAPPPRREEEPRDDVLAESRPAPQDSQRPMGKRDKRRRRGRNRDRHPQDNRDQRPPEPSQQNHNPPEDHLPPETHDYAPEADEAPKAPSFISKLFPPPPTLIKESLSRYKTTESGEFTIEERTTEETIFEHPQELEDDNEE